MKVGDKVVAVLYTIPPSGHAAVDVEILSFKGNTILVRDMSGTTRYVQRRWVFASADDMRRALKVKQEVDLR